MSNKVLNIVAIVGSLRNGSLNRQLVEVIAKLSETRLKIMVPEIGDLPLYNEDLWKSPPESVERFKREVDGADGIIFASPEYNRSVTPALKNAIDWGSRPYGQSSWTGKPASIIGTSPGQVGSAVVQAHLRNVAAILGMAVLGQPEVQITFRQGLFNEDLTVADPELKKFLEMYIEAFESWVKRFAASE